MTELDLPRRVDPSKTNATNPDAKPDRGHKERRRVGRLAVMLPEGAVVDKTKYEVVGVTPSSVTDEGSIEHVDPAGIGAPQETDTVDWKPAIGVR